MEGVLSAGGANAIISPVLAILLALGTAAVWGANPLFARRAMQKVDVVSANFYGIIVGLVIVTAYSFFSGELAAVPQMRTDQLLTFVAVGVITIVLGRTSFYLSINRIGPGASSSIVASSILVAPVIAFFALSETINLKMALGILLVFAGIYFVARRDA